MKRFGLRVAELSPHLALGFGSAAIAIWVVIPAPAEFWLATVALGLAAGLVALRLYKTGDMAYVLPYATLIAMFPLVGRLTLGSFETPVMAGGLVSLIAGITFAIAMMRRYVLEAAETDAS